MSDLIAELQWRGLIKQHTNLQDLRKLLNEEKVTFYCGFDPTAPSLHHGHLVQVILMRHLQNAGHHPIALVGGATGLIGDPRMSAERQLQDKETVASWTQRLKQQLSQFLDFEGDNPAILVNNLDWIGQLSAIDLLRDLGKHFRMGTMLSKDAVARRLASEEGISYTEFSYQILQAYDFLQLNRKYGAVLETGGNDQWGNLIGGMDLIHKVEGRDVHVMTTPLITKSDGTKFGKSEGGAIWLDPDMFSPYQFYQFWLTTEDADVINFLKVFTFLPREEIESLGQEVEQRPGARLAQKVLAKEVTTLVHGPENAQRVIEASNALWGQGNLREADGQVLIQAVENLPSAQVELGKTTLIDMLIESGLEKGRGAARRTMAAGGAYLNNQKVNDEDAPITKDDVLAGNVVLFRKGKRSLGVGYVK